MKRSFLEFSQFIFDKKQETSEELKGFENQKPRAIPNIANAPPY